MPVHIRRIFDAAQDTSLAGSTINQFTLVAFRADDRGEAVVTLREMAAQMNTSINTVSRNFIVLEKSGYIRRQKQSYVGETTTVTILPAPPRSSV